MSVLHRMMNLLVFALLLAVGVFLAGVAFSDEWWEAAAGFVGRSGRYATASWGVGLVCLAALSALSGVKGKRRERILSFRNAEGRISINTQAISDYLGKLADEFPTVVRMRPMVEPRGKTIDIVVDLRVKAGPQLHEVCEVLQRRVRETMLNGLGISDVRRVEVRVREISSEHKGE